MNEEVTEVNCAAQNPAANKARLSSSMTFSQFSATRNAVSFEHACHLISSSTNVWFEGVKASAPDPMELMMGKVAGGRTIVTEDGEWLFSCDKELLMGNPDAPFGIDRADLEKGFHLFMGDEHGLFIFPTNGSMTRAEWLLKMVLTSKTIGWIKAAAPGKRFPVYSVPQFVQTIGMPKYIKTVYFGVVMPMQQGVEDVLISFWYRKGAVRYAEVIANWCLKTMTGEVRVECPLHDNAVVDIYQEYEQYLTTRDGV